MEQKQYKGFAYEKSKSKAVVQYGASKDEILDKLQGFNKARAEAKQFVTCNIGSLTEEGKYADFHKYNVADRTEVERLYFKIPPMSREEFFDTKKSLEEHGARFDPYKKMMYVEKQEDMSFFEPYLGKNQKAAHNMPDSVNPQNEELIETKDKASAVKNEEIKVESGRYITEDNYQEYFNIIENPKVEIPSYSLKTQFKISFDNGKPPIYIDSKDITNLFFNTDVQDVLKKIENKITEILKAEKEYQIEISTDSNRCSVYFKDGREPVEIYGAEYNLDFRNLSKEEVEYFVSEYMDGSDNLHDAFTNEIPEFAVGEKIDVYVPRYDSFKDVSDIGHIQGKVKEVLRSREIVERLTYVVEDELGNEYKIVDKDIYSTQQSEVLLKAISQGVSKEELSLMADPKFSAAQMDELRSGFRDGLNYYEVATYANPKLPVSQMDICRIGLRHGLPLDKLPYTPVAAYDWVEARNQINTEIKLHREELANVYKTAGFKPTDKLVKNLEELNLVKHRPQTIEDINKAYKGNLDLGTKEGQLIKDIGDTLKYQEMQLNRGLCPGG